MARTKQTARKHTAGRGPRKKLATKVRTLRADPDPAPPADVPSIIGRAHQQLADAWVAGSMAEREKLITRLWVRGAKSDVEQFNDELAHLQDETPSRRPQLHSHVL